MLCLSHLRWNFVFQRPQHLMTRFAADRRVYFLEEPITGSARPLLRSTWANSVCVLTPQVPDGLDANDCDSVVRRMVRSRLEQEGVVDPIVWFYTPMMLPLVEDLPAGAVVYDCMDELSAFKFAPPALGERERRLMQRADLVFTGGQSLYEARKTKHPSVHAFPSSVDVAHFARARMGQRDPVDQAPIGRPRVGYCGVIDERMDLALLREAAAIRPDWNFVMVGPVVKLDESDVPRAANIHYLGMKTYDELPAYLAGWDVAMLPFARNEATRFISPTKTPEYLAAGRPVVSTSVRDVVRPYGEQGFVRIADSADAFVAAIDAALTDKGVPAAAERFVANLSWDRTWAGMNTLIEKVLRRSRPAQSERHSPLVSTLPSSMTTGGAALTGEK
jgi:UDP-galactopyranose mutase